MSSICKIEEEELEPSLKKVKIAASSLSVLQSVLLSSTALFSILSSFFLYDDVSIARMRTVCSKRANLFHSFNNQYPDQRIVIQYHYLTQLATIYIRSYTHIYESEQNPRVIPVRPDARPYNHPNTRFNKKTRPELFEAYPDWTINGDPKLERKTTEIRDECIKGCYLVSNEIQFEKQLHELSPWLKQKAHSIIVNFVPDTPCIAIEDIVESVQPIKVAYTCLYTDEKGENHPVITEEDTPMPTYVVKDTRRFENETKRMIVTKHDRLTDHFAAMFVNHVLAESPKCNMLFMDELPLGEKWRTTNLPRKDLFLSLQLGEQLLIRFTQYISEFERLELMNDSSFAHHFLIRHNPPTPLVTYHSWATQQS